MMIAMVMLASAAAWLAPLEPLQSYVGHCWVTDMPGGAIDRHCFTPVFANKHVRDTHVVTRNGEPIYSGETVYSVDDGTIVFTYWNSLGGMGRGTATIVGGDLHFTMSMRSSPGEAPQRYDSVWHLTDQGYDATTGSNTRHFKRDD